MVAKGYAQRDTLDQFVAVFFARGVEPHHRSLVMRLLDFLQLVFGLCLLGAFFQFVFSDFPNKTMSTNCKKATKICLAVLTALITISFLVALVLITKSITLDSGIDNLPFNDVTAKSIETQLDLSKTLFEITLLMIGALWALVIAKKDEAQLVLSDWRQVVMFVSASTVLLISACSYCLYLQNVSHYFVDASVAASKGGIEPTVPDIFDQNINYLFRCQIVSLGTGIFNGTVTLISAYKLKD